VAPLGDAGTWACVQAERAVSRALGGSCTIPLGAYAEMSGKDLRLRALVAAPDGKRIARADCTGAGAEPEALGARAATELRAGGAVEILSSIAK
jgi:hydroxymethylbilane synthase